MCDIIDTMKNIEDALRRAARTSGMSINAMALQSKIPYAALHHFVTKDEKTLTLRTAAKLAKTLGLELRRATKRKAR